MSAPEAMQALETVLAVPRASQLVVSTGDLDARIDQWVRLQSLHTLPSRQRLPKAGRDAPRDETESRICAIWQDALGTDEIGVHDSFADLGGHSLIAIRIVAQLRQAFDLELPMRALFDAPTIAELSARIKREMLAEIAALTDEQAAQLVSNP